MRSIGLTVLLATSLQPTVGSAYGPTGHLIAGIAAEPLLCESAAAVVADLGEGQSLGELGLWADQIRSDNRWDQAAPWHFVNVEIDLNDLVHPPEGDVLWAIEHFSAELRRDDLVDVERAQALKFLVHFIVDLHQPLHVGLESDRGGNYVEVRYADTTTNLHSFWDNDVIELTGLDVPGYVALIKDRVRRAHERDVEVGSTHHDWARESLSLRRAVYRFNESTTERLPDTYLRDAQDLTKERLIRASARLASTLNAIFCP